MHNASELIHFLSSLGVVPKKSLSQNFIIDANIVKKMLRTAELSATDVVLEIGPGPGALTIELLKSGATVIAIEKDPVFAKALTRLQTEDKRLTVHCGDALKFPLEELSFNKIIANLPYHITTPLLEKFFAHPCTSLTLMVQKELADRLHAQNNTKEFGSLTIFTQFHTTYQSSFIVPPTCFYPKPSVDSAVIHLHFRKEPTKEKELFFTLVRHAFQQRRKMLSSSLKKFASSQIIRNALLETGLREDARPEMLSLNQWLLFLDNFMILNNTIYHK